ncbi:MAG: hypothetical protein E7422_01280 [Ruminococcaceae bacterium]|nr:hypothetical protein [Oscillospiraceae bacterium]
MKKALSLLLALVMVFALNSFGVKKTVLCTLPFTFASREHFSGIEDLKGMKLRVSNDPIMNGLVEGLGASPTVVSFGELYSALNSGVCDGAEEKVLTELRSEGVNIVEVTDKTPWANAVKDVVSQYTTGDLGDLYNQIQAMK